MSVIMGFFIVFLGLAFAGLVVYTSSLIQSQEAPTSFPLQMDYASEHPFKRKLFYALTLRGYMAYPHYRVGKYRYDLFIPPNILIDFGGMAYHLDKNREKRNAFLRKQGYKVILFNRPQINRDINGIIKRIEKELSSTGDSFE